MSGLQRSQMGIDNLCGEHRFIVASTLNGDDSPAGVGNQNKYRGGGEPSPGWSRRRDNDRTRRTGTGENFLAKWGRSLFIELRNVHGRSQRLESLECVDTNWTAFEVSFEFSGTQGIQLAIEVAMENGGCAATAHGWPPWRKGQQALIEAAGGHGKPWTLPFLWEWK